MARIGIHLLETSWYISGIFSLRFLVFDISQDCLASFLAFPKPTAKLLRLALDRVSSKMLVAAFCTSTLLFSLLCREGLQRQELGG